MNSNTDEFTIELTYRSVKLKKNEKKIVEFLLQIMCTRIQFQALIVAYKKILVPVLQKIEKKLILIS